MNWIEKLGPDILTSYQLYLVGNYTHIISLWNLDLSLTTPLSQQSTHIVHVELSFLDL